MSFAIELQSKRDLVYFLFMFLLNLRQDKGSCFTKICAYYLCTNHKYYFGETLY